MSSLNNRNMRDPAKRSLNTWTQKSGPIGVSQSKGCEIFEKSLSCVLQDGGYRRMEILATS